MNLEEMLLDYTNRIGQVRFSNSFGWICMYTGKNLFGGYKAVDNEIVVIWLILSPDCFEMSLETGFEKFDFGKTWAQTEVIGIDDFPRIEPFILDAFNFTKERGKHKNR